MLKNGWNNKRLCEINSVRTLVSCAAEGKSVGKANLASEFPKKDSWPQGNIRVSHHTQEYLLIPY